MIYDPSASWRYLGPDPLQELQEQQETVADIDQARSKLNQLAQMKSLFEQPGWQYLMGTVATYAEQETKVLLDRAESMEEVLRRRGRLQGLTMLLELERNLEMEEQHVISRLEELSGSEEDTR